MRGRQRAASRRQVEAAIRRRHRAAKRRAERLRRTLAIIESAQRAAGCWLPISAADLWRANGRGQ